MLANKGILLYHTINKPSKCIRKYGFMDHMMTTSRGDTTHAHMSAYGLYREAFHWGWRQNYMPVESFLCAKYIGVINPHSTPMVWFHYTQPIGNSVMWWIADWQNGKTAITREYNLTCFFFLNYKKVQGMQLTQILYNIAQVMSSPCSVKYLHGRDQSALL